MYLLILWFVPVYVSLFVYKKTEVYIIYWMGFYLGVLLVSCFIGLLNNSSMSYIFEDLKPLLIFLLLPFISQNINNRRNLEKTIKIIIYGALILALFEFVFVYLLYTKTIDFNEI